MVAEVKALAFFWSNSTSPPDSFPCFQGDASTCHGSNQRFRKQREDHLSRPVCLISNLSAEVPVKSRTLQFSCDEICGHVSSKNARRCRKHLAQNGAFARPQSRGRIIASAHRVSTFEKYDFCDSFQTKSKGGPGKRNEEQVRAARGWKKASSVDRGYLPWLLNHYHATVSTDKHSLPHMNA